MIKFFLTGFFLLLSAGANSASFDCGKARTSIEKTICNNKKLSQLDEVLSHAYKDLVRKFPIKGFVQAQQREWLKDIRLIRCKENCANELIDEYSKRIDALKIPDETILYSNTLKFDYSSGDAVLMIVPKRDRDVIKIWGGFRIHKIFSQEAGEAVYFGCEFNGVILSKSPLKASDGEVTIDLIVKGNEISIINHREICAGFGSIPDELIKIQ